MWKSTLAAAALTVLSWASPQIVKKSAPPWFIITAFYGETRFTGESDCGVDVDGKAFAGLSSTFSARSTPARSLTSAEELLTMAALIAKLPTGGTSDPPAGRVLRFRLVGTGPQPLDRNYDRAHLPDALNEILNLGTISK